MFEVTITNLALILFAILLVIYLYISVYIPRIKPSSDKQTSDNENIIDTEKVTQSETDDTQDSEQINIDNNDNDKVSVEQEFDTDKIDDISANKYDTPGDDYYSSDKEDDDYLYLPELPNLKDVNLYCWYNDGLWSIGLIAPIHTKSSIQISINNQPLKVIDGFYNTYYLPQNLFGDIIINQNGKQHTIRLLNNERTSRYLVFKIGNKWRYIGRYIKSNTIKKGYYLIVTHKENEEIIKEEMGEPISESENTVFDDIIVYVYYVDEKNVKPLLSKPEIKIIITDNSQHIEVEHQEIPVEIQHFDILSNSNRVIKLQINNIHKFNEAKLLFESDKYINLDLDKMNHIIPLWRLKEYIENIEVPYIGNNSEKIHLKVSPSEENIIPIIEVKYNYKYICYNCNFKTNDQKIALEHIKNNINDSFHSFNQSINNYIPFLEKVYKKNIYHNINLSCNSKEKFLLVLSNLKNNVKLVHKIFKCIYCKYIVFDEGGINPIELVYSHIEKECEHAPRVHGVPRNGYILIDSIQDLIKYIEDNDVFDLINIIFQFNTGVEDSAFILCITFLVYECTLCGHHFCDCVVFKDVYGLKAYDNNFIPVQEISHILDDLRYDLYNQRISHMIEHHPEELTKCYFYDSTQ